MPNAKLAAIYAVFKQHGVEIDQSAIWEVQGTPVVRHKDVERLGAALGIVYDEPKILRSERDEAVILVIGRISERMEWSIGEAVIGVNYRVSGKQAAYPWAMAEKRAKDRVILKLAQLHGNAYSEDEADEFKSGKPTNQPEDERTEFDRMADELIDAIQKRDPTKLSKLVTHPVFVEDYARLDNYNKARVDNAYEARKDAA